jgi:hypothetical protein
MEAVQIRIKVKIRTSELQDGIEDPAGKSEAYRRSNVQVFEYGEVDLYWEGGEGGF